MQRYSRRHLKCVVCVACHMLSVVLLCPVFRKRRTVCRQSLTNPSSGENKERGGFVSMLLTLVGDRRMGSHANWTDERSFATLTSRWAHRVLRKMACHQLCAPPFFGWVGIRSRVAQCYPRVIQNRIFCVHKTTRCAQTGLLLLSMSRQRKTQRRVQTPSFSVFVKSFRSTPTDNTEDLGRKPHENIALETDALACCACTLRRRGVGGVR